MLLDHLTHADFYQMLPPRLWRGLEFLRDANLAELPLGRHEVEGDKLFALVQEYTTRPLTECQYEAHRRYCDIQCVAVGTERIGWAPLGAMKETIAYSAERDIAFFTGQGQLLTLLPGMFAIFAPHDVHMPCVEMNLPTAVRKIVMKVEL